MDRVAQTGYEKGKNLQTACKKHSTHSVGKCRIYASAGERPRILPQKQERFCRSVQKKARIFASAGRYTGYEVNVMHKAKIVCAAALGAVFLLSGGLLVRQAHDEREGQAAYVRAAQLADLPVPQREPETAEAPAVETAAELPAQTEQAPDEPVSRNIEALRAVNAEVLGWLEIPGTGISYPLVQGTDNEYYLNHTWEGRRSAVGAIFVDSRCAADFSGFNTIIYGHRMNSGTMFAALKYYGRQSYAQEHPCIGVTDRNGTYTYRIYAAYAVSVEGLAFETAFLDESARAAFIEDGLSRSVLAAGAVPDDNSRILTLCTCTGRGHAERWVVQAVREDG